MKITARKEIILRQIRSPKKHMREYADFCISMIEALTNQYRNETLLKLNKESIEKFDGSAFTDSQIGNYARIFMSLDAVAKRKILKRFNDDRIHKKVKELLTKVYSYNKSVSYDAIFKAVGIDPAVLIAGEALSTDFNALIDSYTFYIKQLRDETLQKYALNTLDMMNKGKLFDEIMETFDLTASKRKNVAKSTARQQVASFNNTFTKLRYQNLGIDEAVWVTNIDGRQRVADDDRNGKRYKLSEGCYSSVDKKYKHPGDDYGCRCGLRAIIPSD